MTENQAKMMRMSSTFAHRDDARLTGQLLIAMPSMEDPRFAHSVIYLCAHTEEGAMGLVVNRPLASPTFEDLLKQLDVAPTPPARRISPVRWRPRGWRARLRAAHLGLDQ